MQRNIFFLLTACCLWIYLLALQDHSGETLVIGRAVSGVLLVIFFPGYRIQTTIFEHEHQDIIELLVYSFCLSCASMFLLIFYFNLRGFEVTPDLVLAISGVLCGCCFVIQKVRHGAGFTFHGKQGKSM